MKPHSSSPFSYSSDDRLSGGFFSDEDQNTAATSPLSSAIHLDNNSSKYTRANRFTYNNTSSNLISSLPPSNIPRASYALSSSSSSSPKKNEATMTIKGRSTFGTGKSGL